MGMTEVSFFLQEVKFFIIKLFMRLSFNLFFSDDVCKINKMILKIHNVRGGKDDSVREVLARCYMLSITSETK